MTKKFTPSEYWVNRCHNFEAENERLKVLMTDNERIIQNRNELIGDLQAENERLREALKAVEWIWDDISDGYCPWCNGRFNQEWGYDGQPLPLGHREDCLRRRALEQKP